ncbi:MAG: gluconate 2-dehydrogenase subunit 3 family protein [Proteobacteria bacterium]|nr:gluconate 2-dehydrogenase subunit 3 family protein [Pseudomonadota bacterium]
MVREGRHSATDEDRFPGYDVANKRDTLSWDAVTRTAINRRLAVPHEPRFLAPPQWRTLDALCRRILPQPADRPPIPLAALLDATLCAGGTQGFRVHPLPHDPDAWKHGLDALDAEAREQFGAAFCELAEDTQDSLLVQAQNGKLHNPAWDPMTAQLFFEKRILVDIPAMYYSHPTAWNEIGFGGPASPRGYVRMELNRRDPWEAVERKPGHEAEARLQNRHVG